MAASSVAATSCTRAARRPHSALLALDPVELLERDLVDKQQVAEVVGQARGAGEDAADERQQGRVVGGLGVEGLGDDGGEVVVGREGDVRERRGRGRGVGNAGDVGESGGDGRRRRIHGSRTGGAWTCVRGGLFAAGGKKWDDYFAMRVDGFGCGKQGSELFLVRDSMPAATIASCGHSR